MSMDRDTAEFMTRGIRSTPENLLKVYQTNRPSELTHMNFYEFTGHFGDVRGSVKSQLERFGESLHTASERLATAHHEAPAALSEEMRVYRSVFGSVSMIESLYLASLDIPAGVKFLYPSSEMDGNFVGRAYKLFDKLYRPVTKLLPNPLESKATTVLDVAVFAAFIVPFGLFYFVPGAVYHKTKCVVARQINESHMNEPDRVPLDENSFSGYERFWLYFKYNPDKDTPVDFDDDSFNPTPEINSNYFPRRNFKEYVSKLYRVMSETLAYYRSHDVPFEDNDIENARDVILGRMRRIDSSAVTGDVQSYY